MIQITAARNSETKKGSKRAGERNEQVPEKEQR